MAHSTVVQCGRGQCGPSVPSAAVSVTPTGVSCVYALGASGVSVGAGTSFGNVGVTAGAACPWTALSNASWLAVTSSAVGTGNGSVGYSVAANPGVGSRIGTLTIAGQTFTVTQAGALSPPVCTLSAVPSSVLPGGISTLTATCSPGATSIAGPAAVVLATRQRVARSSLWRLAYIRLLEAMLVAPAPPPARLSRFSGRGEWVKDSAFHGVSDASSPSNF